MSIYKIISICILSFLIINGIISLIRGTYSKIELEHKKTGSKTKINFTALFMIVYVSLLIWLIN